MEAGLLLGAVGLFAVTNVDDVVLLTLYFGRAKAIPGAERRIVIGQYLGFAVIVAVSLAGSLGVGLLPQSAIAYLGLLPIAIGVRAAVTTWRQRRAGEPSEEPVSATPLAARRDTRVASSADRCCAGVSRMGHRRGFATSGRIRLGVEREGSR